MPWYDKAVPCDDCGTRVKEVHRYGDHLVWSEQLRKHVHVARFLCASCVARREAEKKIVRFPRGEEL